MGRFRRKKPPPPAPLAASAKQDAVTQDETASPIGDVEPDMEPELGRTDGGGDLPTASSEASAAATVRWFRVENHLHLNLNLRLRGVYKEAELRRRCAGDASKLRKLEEFLNDSAMLKQVQEPENASATKQRPQAQVAPSKRPGPSEEEARRLRRRAMSRKLCIGQLVWDCSVQPARAARITAICAREERPFLVRHLDGSPAVGSRSSFSVNDPVTVNGRPCIVTWDGRPSHQFAKVRWEDGTESDVLPVCSIQPNKTAVEEEVFVSDFALEPLDLSHLLRSASPPTCHSEKAAPSTPASVIRAPTGVTLRSSEARAGLRGLRPGQVCWSFGGNRLPWPVKLVHECPETRVWRVQFLGAEWREETLSASCLRPYVQGDGAALAEVLLAAEEEHGRSGEAAAEKAKSAAKDASKETEVV